MKKQIIDFVITWVDGSDPLWFRQKQNAKKKQGVSVDIDDRIERYRDWEILKYLFRSIENFAPWVNNVYFVTCGHLPAWLNTECPKLQIVSHKDFIPEKYLPTFNSHSIEWNFHRIKNLSEHFVYFNDDDVGVKTINKFNPIPYSTLKNSYFVVYRRGLGNI